MSDRATVLYDAPGPRARMRNRVLTVVCAVIVLAVLYYVYAKFDAKGQWAAAKWTPFLQGDVWVNYLLSGLLNTLTAAVLGSVFAMIFGVVFGIARLSKWAWIRLPAGVVVEVFRAIPLLMLIFFILTGSYPLFGVFTDPLTAVVGGLTLYNGSVIAEVVRAGINAVPKGQSEAAQSIGLRPGEVMRSVLLPQAITAMMPAIVSQLIILLKDSALGFIVAYPELVSQSKIAGNFFGNVIPTMIVVAVIYIIVNFLLGRFANWLERRNARRGRGSAAAPAAAGVDLEVNARV